MASNPERLRQELQTCTHTIEGCREEIERQNSRIQEIVTELEE